MFRPLSLKTVRWRPLEGEGLEHLTVRAVEGGIRAESVIIGERDAAAYGVTCRIDCDDGWRVRSFHLRDTTGRELELASDGNGHWQRPDGTALPEFDGCIDIDLSGSPFTNTLPIRRLNLDPSQGTARLRMVYIPFDNAGALRRRPALHLPRPGEPLSLRGRGRCVPRRTACR